VPCPSAGQLLRAIGSALSVRRLAAFRRLNEEARLWGILSAWAPTVCLEMPRSGICSGRKRKRNWDIEYPSFPRGSPLKFRRAGLRTVGAAASLSEAWLRCGEGFQDTSGTLSLTAEKKIITEKNLKLSPGPKKGN
ncbi:unnamed protein product, partial [Gulo gulo]